MGGGQDGHSAEDPPHLRPAHLHQAHQVSLLQQAAGGGDQAGGPVQGLSLQCSQEMFRASSSRLHWRDSY